MLIHVQMMLGVVRTKAPSTSPSQEDLRCPVPLGAHLTKMGVKNKREREEEYEEFATPIKSEDHRKGGHQGSTKSRLCHVLRAANRRKRAIARLTDVLNGGELANGGSYYS